MRVAAIQMCSTDNREANLEKARGLMEEAVLAGAQSGGAAGEFLVYR